MNKFNQMKVEKKLGLIITGVSVLTIITIVTILLTRNLSATTELLKGQLGLYARLNATLLNASKFPSFFDI